ncbi:MULTISPECIES: HD domain-containing protein [unclassified Thermosipho (in: thermotogales)]|uniref:HD domain-containing protein n=1 Tax=unclassified Thermosipho (in: thermotogales) TaxID=2676525 RepID=UPI0009870FB0|nr:MULTISPECIES: HD domain-containing protein [unclassified Thermosipho (in: thermotogales)]MBT1247516.1 phosphohydrolase [Thermosipho sp. 1244]OOC42078.1 phosphohydrolase [Thermosipho sp. 1074]OOC46240.1 phosphohydrolase [Thermosipho sp. 1223]
MNRNEAFELLKEHIKTKNLIKHCIATEALMRKFAKHFNEDEEEWGIAGLLHDLDYEYTKDDPALHGLKTVEILGDSVSDNIKNAILAHCGKKRRETLMEKVIYAADPTTGFIVASALIRPEKKLEPVDVKFLLKRFKEKSFAKGANREQMKSCEEFGMELEEFFEKSLEAMKEISKELGL